MLRCFSVVLKNTSSERLRLSEVYIGQPENSEFAIRWHVPIMILGGSSHSGPPWEFHRRYNINETLDPGEEYDFEFGIPSGFGISASRQPPVTISIDFITLGLQERRITQDIKRNIAF
ncbi:hypothetical protein SAMN05216337_1002352 [Bradyrhizobium brasilense]|uniref:Uncharacterized protein n=2 Tax=Bradyrhizobium brasilense TaxID=1419277 RepID=A0A1G6L7I2_9BRAD|nr:hypothetical protein SAMN05216337_1002352 [Bradyrhizobium brasilense]